jgi:hypothetical protein
MIKDARLSSDAGVLLATRCAPAFRANGVLADRTENARLVKTRSAEFVLDVRDAGRVDCPDLLERPAVEPRE